VRSAPAQAMQSAYEGLCTLRKQSHAERIPTVLDADVVQRLAGGTLLILQRRRRGPAGTDIRVVGAWLASSSGVPRC